MTYPRRPEHQRPVDPLTDSAAHRLGLGTQVRLHLYGGEHADISLTAVRDVATWHDLADRIVRRLPLEVLAPLRCVFDGGSIMWAEVLIDTTGGPAARTFDSVNVRPPIRP